MYTFPFKTLCYEVVLHETLMLLWVLYKQHPLKALLYVITQVNVIFTRIMTSTLRTILLQQKVHLLP